MANYTENMPCTACSHTRLHLVFGYLRETSVYETRGWYCQTKQVSSKYNDYYTFKTLIIDDQVH